MTSLLGNILCQAKHCLPQLDCFGHQTIKLISGQSVNAFIRYLRLRKAAEFLISTNDTVAQVAYSVGFSDVKYFREQFVRLFKMKPTEYIKQYRKKMGDNLRIDDPNEG